jgi:hypothetical protein
MLSDDGPETRAVCAAWAERLFRRSWDTVRGTLYANDCVVNDSSTLPVSLDHLLWLAEEKNSLKDWDSSKSDALAPTKANLDRLLAERDAALSTLDSMTVTLNEAPPGLRPEALADLRARFGVARLYLRVYAAATGAIFTTRAAIDAPHVLSRAHDAIAALVLLADECRTLESGEHRPVIPTLLSAERLLVLRDDLLSRLNASSATA